MTLNAYLRKYCEYCKRLQQFFQGRIYYENKKQFSKEEKDLRRDAYFSCKVFPRINNGIFKIWIFPLIWNFIANLAKNVSYDCALKIFKMKIQNHYYGYKPKTESYSILRGFWIGINQI